MSKLLILPDAHAHPDYSNIRFRWAGRCIAVEQPDIIVCLGDFGDMPSLVSPEKKGRTHYRRRYRSDINAVRAAMNEMLDYSYTAPRMIMLGGNHEDRIRRYVDTYPEMEEYMMLSDLGYEDFGWTVVPFKEIIEVAGFAFSHHFPSGVMGRPIGGENHAATLVNKLHTSAVAGHSHLLGYAQRTNAYGDKLHGIVAGCWTHPEYVEDWCRNIVHLWYHGIIILEGVKQGDFEEMRVLSMHNVKNRYK